MRKISLLFIPLLFVLSCKKSEKPVSPVVEELDMSEPFKGVIFSDYEKTDGVVMRDLSETNYLGFVTDIKSVNTKDFNFFNGVRLINLEYSLKNVNEEVVKKYELKESVLSEYRNALNGMVLNMNHTFSPKVSYQIYAPESITNARETKITLVLKALYYYLDLSGLKDDNLKLSPDVRIDEVKASGAYLSRIGYGQQFVFEIATTQDPKKVLVYLKAYLDDILNNNGKKAAELSKGFDIPSEAISILGPSSVWSELMVLNNKERIERIIDKVFIPRPVSNPLAMVDFKFSPFTN